MNLLNGLSLVVSTLFVVALLACGVAMLRTKQHLLLGALSAIFASTLFVAAGIGLHFVNQATNSLLLSLSASESLPPLPSDWGSNFSAEDRTRYSLGMARSAYLRRGILREYIDLAGARHMFTPDENDKVGRQKYVEDIEFKKRVGDLAEMGIYGLILLYCLGVAFGFTRRWQQLTALTLRSSGTRPRRAP